MSSTVINSGFHERTKSFSLKAERKQREELEKSKEGRHKRTKSSVNR